MSDWTTEIHNDLKDAKEILGDLQAEPWEVRNGLRIMVHHVEDLQKRQEELLATIVKLSRETPYEEEASTNATLIAEVGTLRARVRELENEQLNLKSDVLVFKTQRDRALENRNKSDEQIAKLLDETHKTRVQEWQYTQQIQKLTDQRQHAYVELAVSRLEVLALEKRVKELEYMVREEMRSK